MLEFGGFYKQTLKYSLVTLQGMQAVVDAKIISKVKASQDYLGFVPGFSNDSNVSLSFGVSFLAQNQVFKLWTLGVPQLRHMYGDSHVHAGELKEG